MTENKEIDGSLPTRTLKEIDQAAEQSDLQTEADGNPDRPVIGHSPVDKEQLNRLAKVPTTNLLSNALRNPPATWSSLVGTVLAFLASGLDFKGYLNGFRRNLPYAVIIVLGCSVMSVLLAIQLPSVFEVSSKIVIRASDSGSNPGIQLQLSDRQQTTQLLRSRLSSRDVISSIIQEYDYNPSPEGMTIGEKVARFRADLSVDVQILDRGNEVKNDLWVVTVIFLSGSADEAANIANQVSHRAFEEFMSIRASSFSSQLLTHRAQVQEISRRLENLESGLSANSGLSTGEALRPQNQYLLDLLQSAQDRLRALEIMHSLHDQGVLTSFEMLDEAVAPDRPISPGRRYIVASGVSLGIVYALLLLFLLELLNRGIRSQVDFELRMKQRPLANVPYVESRRELILRRVAIFLLVAMVLVGVPSGLWYIDSYYLPLQPIVERILDRLGLSN